MSSPCLFHRLLPVSVPAFYLFLTSMTTLMVVLRTRSRLIANGQWPLVVARVVVVLAAVTFSAAQTPPPVSKPAAFPHASLKHVLSLAE